MATISRYPLPLQFSSASCSARRHVVSLTRFACVQAASPALPRRLATDCALIGQIADGRKCFQCRASSAGQPTEPKPLDDAEEFSGLTPEEDVEVPGGYSDAMNGNTRLGKAVRAACTEIKTLNQLEADNLKQAQELLKKLGLKSPLLEPPPVPATEEEEEDDE